MPSSPSSAVGDVFYWPSYHAYFAALGDDEHRGHQIGAREALSAVVGIVAPLLGAWAIVAAGPLLAFTAVGLVQALAVVPLDRRAQRYGETDGARRLQGGAADGGADGHRRLVHVGLLLRLADRALRLARRQHPRLWRRHGAGRAGRRRRRPVDRPSCRSRPRPPGGGDRLRRRRRRGRAAARLQPRLALAGGHRQCARRARFAALRRPAWAPPCTPWPRRRPARYASTWPARPDGISAASSAASPPPGSIAAGLSLRRASCRPCLRPLAIYGCSGATMRKSGRLSPTGAGR